MIQEYIDYVKDNPKGLWFKAKLYGWGWTPVTWQGWLILLVYIALILALVTSREEYIPGNEMSGSNFLVFALPIILLTIVFVIILYKKGERPRWQWGSKDKQHKPLR